MEELTPSKSGTSVIARSMSSLPAKEREQSHVERLKRAEKVMTRTRAEQEPPGPSRRPNVPHSSHRCIPSWRVSPR